MKKNILLYSILATLIALAVFYYTTTKKSTLSEREGALSDFSIKDTASINKIFIADYKGESVTLTRNERAWLVNDKYDARPDNVKMLLEAFFKIAVKMPVSNAAFDNVVKNIATNAIKVEIYQGQKKPSKVYYLGGPTANHQGTYMLLEEDGEKSTLPYIMHLPGFYGYLTARFFTNTQQWRDAVIFKTPAEAIKRITVEHHETPEESFVLEQQNGQWKLLTFKDEKAVNNVDANKLENYVTRYEKIYYEMIDEDATKEKIDSVIASPPYFSITVNSTDGVQNKVVAYHMPNFRQLANGDSEVFPYDVDRMYGYLNEDLFLFIQFSIFDKLKLPKLYFLKK